MGCTSSRDPVPPPAPLVVNPQRSARVAPVPSQSTAVPPLPPPEQPQGQRSELVPPAAAAPSSQTNSLRTLVISNDVSVGVSPSQGSLSHLTLEPVQRSTPRLPPIIIAQASLGIDLSRQNSPVGGLRQPLVTDLAVGVGITSPADANRSVDETQSIPNVSGVLSKAGTSEEEIRTLKSKLALEQQRRLQAETKLADWTRSSASRVPMSSATPPLCVQVTGSVNIPPLPTAAKASIAAELVSGVAIASQSGPASIVEDSRVPTPPAEVRSSVLEDEIRALKSKLALEQQRRLQAESKFADSLLSSKEAVKPGLAQRSPPLLILQPVNGISVTPAPYRKHVLTTECIVGVAIAPQSESKRLAEDTRSTVTAVEAPSRSALLETELRALKSKLALEQQRRLQVEGKLTAAEEKALPSRPPVLTLHPTDSISISQRYPATASCGVQTGSSMSNDSASVLSSEASVFGLFHTIWYLNVTTGGSAFSPILHDALATCKPGDEGLTKRVAAALLTSQSDVCSASITAITACVASYCSGSGLTSHTVALVASHLLIGLARQKSSGLSASIACSVSSIPPPGDTAAIADADVRLLLQTAKELCTQDTVPAPLTSVALPSPQPPRPHPASPQLATRPSDTLVDTIYAVITTMPSQGTVSEADVTSGLVLLLAHLLCTTSRDALPPLCASTALASYDRICDRKLVSLEGLENPATALVQRFEAIVAIVSRLSSVVRESKPEDVSDAMLTEVPIATCCESCVKRFHQTSTVLSLLVVALQCLRVAIQAVVQRKRANDSCSTILVSYFKELGSACGWLTMKSKRKMVVDIQPADVRDDGMLSLYQRLLDLCRRLHRIIPESTLCQSFASPSGHRHLAAVGPRVPSSGSSRISDTGVSRVFTPDEMGSEEEEQWEEDEEVLSGSDPTGLQLSLNSKSRGLWNRPSTADPVAAAALEAMEASSSAIPWLLTLSHVCISISDAFVAVAQLADRASGVSRMKFGQSFRNGLMIPQASSKPPDTPTFVQSVSAVLGSVTLLLGRLLSSTVSLDLPMLRCQLFKALDALLAVSGGGKRLEDAHLMSTPRASVAGHTSGLRLPGLQSVVMLLHSQMCVKTAPVVLSLFNDSFAPRAIVRLLLSSCDSSDSLSTLPPLLLDILQLCPLDRLAASFSEPNPLYRCLSTPGIMDKSPVHLLFHTLSLHKLTLNVVSVVLQLIVDLLGHVSSSGDRSVAAYSGLINHVCHALPLLSPCLQPPTRKLHPQILLAVCAITDRSAVLACDRLRAERLPVESSSKPSVPTPVSATSACEPADVIAVWDIQPVLAALLCSMFPECPFGSTLSAESCALLKLSTSVHILSEVDPGIKVSKVKGSSSSLPLIQALSGTLSGLERLRGAAWKHWCDSRSSKGKAPVVESSVPFNLPLTSLTLVWSLLQVECARVMKLTDAQLAFEGAFPSLSLVSRMLWPALEDTVGCTKLAKLVCATELSRRSCGPGVSEWSSWALSSQLTLTLCIPLLKQDTRMSRLPLLAFLFRLVVWFDDGVRPVPPALMVDDTVLCEVAASCLQIPAQGSRGSQTSSIRSDWALLSSFSSWIPALVAIPGESALIQSCLSSSLESITGAVSSKLSACVALDGTVPWRRAYAWKSIGLSAGSPQRLCWLALLTRILRLPREAYTAIPSHPIKQLLAPTGPSSFLEQFVAVSHSVLSMFLLRQECGEDDVIPSITSLKDDARWTAVVSFTSELIASAFSVSDASLELSVDLAPMFYHPILSILVKTFPALLWKLAATSSGGTSSQSTTPGKPVRMLSKRWNTGGSIAAAPSPEWASEVSLADTHVDVGKVVELFTSLPALFSLHIKLAVLRIVGAPAVYPYTPRSAPKVPSLTPYAYASPSIHQDVHVLTSDVVKPMAPTLALSVSRDSSSVWSACVDQLFGDAVDPERLKQHWSVRFEGEPAVDENGVRREFISAAAKLFMTHTLQCPPESDTYSFSSAVGDELGAFAALGRFIGKCILFGDVSGIRFSRGIGQRLVGKHPRAQDLASFDPDLFGKMKTLLSTPNVEEVFGLTFVASKADGSEVELVPGGAQKFVTDGNKAEYVDAYIQFKLCKENDRQFQAMLSGVSSVVPMHAVRVLAEEELTRAIAGEDTISVLDVKLHCLLTEGYTADDPVVHRFFTVLSSWTQPDLRKLLQFVTGSSRLPAGGACALEPWFTLQKASNTRLLPSAATCFNLLKLPPYPTADELNIKLRKSVTEGATGFSFT